MINISIHKNVFKSASEVYFAADALHWILDELPNQSLLNTAEWKLIIPQLYKQYPNDDMNFNISVSSPPVIEVSDELHFLLLKMYRVAYNRRINQTLENNCISKAWYFGHG